MNYIVLCNETTHVDEVIDHGRQGSIHSPQHPVTLANHSVMRSHIAKFMGPIWGPSGSCRPQMGPMLAPWTLLSGVYLKVAYIIIVSAVIVDGLALLGAGTSADIVLIKFVSCMYPILALQRLNHQWWSQLMVWVSGWWLIVVSDLHELIGFDQYKYWFLPA